MTNSNNNDNIVISSVIIIIIIIIILQYRSGSRAAPSAVSSWKPQKPKPEIGPENHKYKPENGF